MVDFKKRDFDEFVKREQAELAESKTASQFDWQTELKDWIDRLESLYSELLSYLDEYTAQGSISAQFNEIELNEDFSGTYTARALTIFVGSKTIKLIPIGTMLIGSRGRVDIVGKFGRARLVLLNAKISRPSQMIRIEVIDPKKPKPKRSEERSPIEWAWKIVGPTQTPTFVELNKDSFLETLLEVSDG